MQRLGAPAEELAAAIDVEAVVRVTTVERASARRHEPGIAQLTKVVRDQVLSLADEFRELANPPIAARQLREDRPSVAIADDPQKLRSLEVLHHHRTIHQSGLMYQVGGSARNRG